MTKKTCLVVDDSSVVRKILRRILDGLDFEVMEAYDGQNALDQCNKKMPDVILLDWNMPVIDGMTFLKSFHEDQKKHGVIVVFCTTENDTVKIMEAMAEGANEYIMKPFDADIIKTRFSQLGLLE